MNRTLLSPTILSPAPVIRMHVNVGQSSVRWTIKEGESVLDQGMAATLEEVRAEQLGRGIEEVVIDPTFRTQEVVEAAFEYGWKTSATHVPAARTLKRRRARKLF